jgi:hypothetical protein
MKAASEGGAHRLLWLFSFVELLLILVVMLQLVDDRSSLGGWQASEPSNLIAFSTPVTIPEGKVLRVVLEASSVSSTGAFFATVVTTGQGMAMPERLEGLEPLSGWIDQRIQPADRGKVVIAFLPDKESASGSSLPAYALLLEKCRATACKAMLVGGNFGPMEKARTPLKDTTP